MATTQTDRSNSTPVSIQNDRASGLKSSAAIKGPVKTVATSNITLSGEQTVNGEACVEGDRVLCISQTSGANNGIYVVSTGEWTRAADFNRTDDVVTGTWVYVWGGNNAGSVYVVTNEGDITIDTTAITFSTLLSVIGYLAAVNNLSDLTNAATARTNLGLTANGSSLVTAANYAAMRALLDLEAGTDFAALGVTVLNNTEDQTLTGGVRVTSKDLGTPSAASTVTLDPGDRPLQHLTNNAAFTLAPGANTGSILLDITNGASAGAITTSGWTKVVGAFTTTNGHKFRCSCSVGNGGSLLSIQALQ